MRTTRGLAAIGAAAAGALLLLTACSSSDPAPAPAASATDDITSAAPQTIVDVASADTDFSTLVAAIDAAGLVDTLSGEGPYTVFAPTNEAFAALPPGVLDALLLPENKDTLTKILTYHVVDGEVTSDQITDGDVPTLEGESVTVSTADGVTVNGAMVVAADVAASNGVIHVIDAVLVPSDVDVAALTS
jgi:uncharacterized surface protein with fasciclin (FAS1) repeats